MPFGKIPGTNFYGQSVTFGGETVWVRGHQNLDANGVAVTQNSNANYRLLTSLATTNAALIKAGPANLFSVRMNNTVALKRFLKIYNKATAPTVGADVSFATFVILPSVVFDLTFTGLQFPLGLGIAITGLAADADATAIGAGDIECLNIGYA